MADVVIRHGPRAMTSDPRLERELDILAAALRGEAPASIAGAHGLSPRSVKRVLRRFVEPPLGPVRTTERTMATLLARHVERLIGACGSSGAVVANLGIFLEALTEFGRIDDLLHGRPRWVEWSVDPDSDGRLWLLLRAVLRHGDAPAALYDGVVALRSGWVAQERTRKRPAIKSRSARRAISQLGTLRPLPPEPPLPAADARPNRFGYDRRERAVVTCEGGEIVMRNPTPRATTARHRRRHDVYLLIASQSGRTTAEIARHWQLSARQASRRLRHFEGSALARTITAAWQDAWERRDRLDRSLFATLSPASDRAALPAPVLARALGELRALFELESLMGLLPRPYRWRYPAAGERSFKSGLAAVCAETRPELSPALADAFDLWVALESQRRLEGWQYGSLLPPPSALPCPPPG